RSPRRAARETFALNSGLNFLGFAMTGYLLSYRVSPLIRAPSFWGAVHPDLFDEIFGDAVKVGSNFIDGGR
ncbi:MAG TPA: hypothetical protein VN641_12145, partial [Urbifossiella sp.]|nr:hypothetical protein [Urbifossiella sp.]